MSLWKSLRIGGFCEFSFCAGFAAAAKGLEADEAIPAPGSTVPLPLRFCSLLHVALPAPGSTAPLPLRFCSLLLPMLAALPHRLRRGLAGASSTAASTLTSITVDCVVRRLRTSSFSNSNSAGSSQSEAREDRGVKDSGVGVCAPDSETSCMEVLAEFAVLPRAPRWPRHVGRPEALGPGIAR